MDLRAAGTFAVQKKCALGHFPVTAERVRCRYELVLGGSWDLVSKVTSALIGVISIVTLTITLVTKSHDPLSNLVCLDAFLHRAARVKCTPMMEGLL